MRLRGREDSVLHANSLTQCLFFPRFQILILFLYFSTWGTYHRFKKGKRRDKEIKHVSFFCSDPAAPGGWIFNIVPRVLLDRNPESKKGQLLILLYSYSRTFTNRRVSTTATCCCPQGGHCGEVQL